MTGPLPFCTLTLMNFLNRCNGYDLSPRMTTTTRQVLDQVLPEAREAFRAFASSDLGRAGRYELGYRFDSNDTVERRITSAIEAEAEFLADPRAWALDALRDCAEADHWYTYEKDWGSDY